MPKAVITGAGGQDAHYLAEFLGGKGYEVFPTYCDVTDADAMRRLFDNIKPDEVYNLAAQMHGPEAYRVAVVGAVNCITLSGDAKVFQAGSSKQDTPSFYGRGKRAACNVAFDMRQSGRYVVSAVLYAHESPRRSTDYAVAKIAHAAVAISRGEQSELVLGNVDAVRDWGHAADFVRAMWMTMQQKHPASYTIATGEWHSVRDVCEVAFRHVGLDYRDYLRTSEEFMRKDDPAVLVGDPKCMQRVHWERKYTFEQTVTEMVDAAASR